MDKHRKQVLYREGGLVWIHLHKKCFPTDHFGKLKPCVDGSFQVLKKINDNAHKIELVSVTFNVVDLSSCKCDSEDEADTRSSLFQKGEDDVDVVNSSVNRQIYLVPIFSNLILVLFKGRKRHFTNFRGLF